MDRADAQKKRKEREAAAYQEMAAAAEAKEAARAKEAAEAAEAAAEAGRAALAARQAAIEAEAARPKISTIADLERASGASAISAAVKAEQLLQARALAPDCSDGAVGLCARQQLTRPRAPTWQSACNEAGKLDAAGAVELLKRAQEMALSAGVKASSPPYKKASSLLAQLECAHACVA